MSYKLVPNAKVPMSTDGTKQLFIDTGHEIVPVNNRLCYAETQRLTFDGDVTGKEAHVHLNLVKVSEEPLTFDTINQVTIHTPNGPVVIASDMLTMINMGDISAVAVPAETIDPSRKGDAFAMISCATYFAGMDLHPGTYVYVAGETSSGEYTNVTHYASCVDYTYIKKIDDKYLPASIPIVKCVDTLGRGDAVTEPAASQIKAYLQQSVPAVVFSYARATDDSSTNGDLTTDMLLQGIHKGAPVYYTVAGLIVYIADNGDLILDEPANVP